MRITFDMCMSSTVPDNFLSFIEEHLANFSAQRNKLVSFLVVLSEEFGDE